MTATGLECVCAASAPISRYLPQTCQPESCEIAAAEIGKPGITVETGGVIVTVDSWTEKSGSPGVYTGFKLSATVPVGAISYDVVTSKATKNSSGATWSGSDSIALINFCDPNDEGVDDPDSSGDDDGTGDDDGAGDCNTDVDGCDPGGGDDGIGDPASDNDDPVHPNDICYCAPPNSEAIDDSGSSGSDSTDCTEDVDGCGDGSGSGSDNDVGLAPRAIRTPG